MAKKLIFIVLIFMFLLISLTPIVYAHCPICTAAVGAAAVSAKYYGLDTSIIGLLIGAFGVSTGLWVGTKMKFKFQLPIIVLASFLLTAMPLRYISGESIYLPLLIFGSSGSFLNRVYFIDKIFFGSLIGGLITLMAYFIHIHIKRLNNKVLFPFQGIAITFSLLLISGLSLYFIFS